MALTAGQVWFITGANRGIGLELVRQLLQSPSTTIIAGCRKPPQATELSKLATASPDRVHVVEIDTANTASVNAAAASTADILGDGGIDYLLNNAGMNKHDVAFAVDFDNMVEVLQTNTIGPARVSQAFLPLVERGGKKTIVNISSTMGSIGSDLNGGQMSYCISKTALNMLTYQQARTRPDLTVISLCPGWLKTDLGGAYAPTPVAEGVSNMLKVIGGIKADDSGKFYNYMGQITPW